MWRKPDGGWGVAKLQPSPDKLGVNNASSLQKIMSTKVRQDTKNRNM